MTGMGMPSLYSHPKRVISTDSSGGKCWSAAFQSIYLFIHSLIFIASVNRMKFYSSDQIKLNKFNKRLVIADWMMWMFNAGDDKFKEDQEKLIAKWST